MGAIADVTEEFKSATPTGKVLMLVVILVVAGIGFYVYKQKQAGNNSTGGTLVPLDMSGGTGVSGFNGSGSTTTTTGGTGNQPVSPVRPSPVGGNPPKAPLPPTQNPASNGKYVTVTKWPSMFSTIWGIAQYYYGNGTLWTRIYNDPHNRGLNPKDLHVGQKIFVPT